MRKYLIAACLAVVSTAAIAADGPQSQAPFQMAAGASSCSGWKAICESRGGGDSCDAKYSSCLSSGCFKEGAQYGGASHCGLAKK